MTTQYTNIADLTITNGSPTVTVNSAENISKYKDGDLIFVTGQNPLIILSILDQAITLRDDALFTATNSPAVIMASNVALREALVTVQTNNSKWNTHFTPLMNFVDTTSPSQINLIDALGNEVLVYSAVGLNELAQDMAGGVGVSKYIELDDVKGVRPIALPVLDENEEMIHLPLVTVGADNDADVSSNDDVFYIVNSSGFLTLSNSQLSSNYTFVAPGSIKVNTSTTKLEVFVSVDFQRNNINATYPLAPCAIEVYIDGEQSGHIVNIPGSDSADVESMSLDFGEITVIAGAKLSLFVTVGDSPNPSAGLTILENTRLYVVNHDIAPNIKIPGELVEVVADDNVLSGDLNSTINELSSQIAVLRSMIPELESNLGLSSSYDDTTFNTSGSATSRIDLNFLTDGTFEILKSGGSDESGQYLINTGPAAANLYEVMYTRLSGDGLDMAPAEGVWHNLAGNQYFILQSVESSLNSTRVREGTYLFKIRNANTLKEKEQTVTITTTAQLGSG